ncbi:MAG: glycosyltransferase family 9 protein [Verrucomicrobiaceae bacterium]|nr:glycosyltransferase family 9 protein [Verrucomicrobiaceae bacterium]
MTLLISKVNQLGDNVVFLPVVQQLRALMPDLRMIVATSPVAAPLFERCVERVEVVTTPTRDFNAAWKHPMRLLELGKEWRRLRPDVVMLGNDQGNVAALLSWLSGAVVRVGPAFPSRPSTPFINHQVSYNLKRHVVLQNWELAQRTAMNLGVSMSGGPPTPNLSGLISGDGEAFDVVVHPGASREYKRWPLDHFVDLANGLSRRYRVAWIDDGRTIRVDPAVKVIRPTSLNDFVTIMAHSKLFIGNNSGPMNIASALGMKGIVFNGPSTDNWDPYWHRERFILLRDPQLSCQPCDLYERPVNVCGNASDPMACMKRWRVEEVSSMANQLLLP